MADATIKQSGGDYTSINAFITNVATGGGDTGTISGTWSVDDTASVTWDTAVIIVATGSSKQIGRPFQSGDTHYRHREGAGHAFTVTADVDIKDVDIQSDSTGVSDELFRSAGAASITLINCQLGFTGNTDQQDVVYTEDNTTKTYFFEQCFFYDVGRSVVDAASGAEVGTLTINFNSCGSFNIGANGARNDGCWYGRASASTNNTVNINTHTCLINVSDSRIFASNGTNGTFASDFAFSILNIAASAAVTNFDTNDQNDLIELATWLTSTASGDPEVIMTNITSTTYNPALVDDNTNNDAQSGHGTLTDAGLTVPTLDILGQTRNTTGDANTLDVGPSALTLAAAVFAGELHNPIFRIKNKGYGHLREAR